MGLVSLDQNLPQKLELVINCPPAVDNSKKIISNVCGSQILPFLFLGGESDALNIEKLKQLNIRYVLNCTTDLPGDGENESIRYKRIPARDSFDQNMTQYFEEAYHFIEEARLTQNNVLVHCRAGISRSPTIVVAYLIRSHKMTLNTAYKYVESKRPIISPNFSFVGQLYDYEIRNTKILSPESPSSRAKESINKNLTTNTDNLKSENCFDALTDISINSLSVSRASRSRKCSNNEFMLLKPMKIAKNSCKVMI